MSTFNESPVYVYIMAIRSQVEQLTAPVSVALTLHYVNKRNKRS